MSVFCGKPLWKNEFTLRGYLARDFWNQRAARLPHSRLVARDQRPLGWTALSPVSKRACYAGVAEVGVYVAAVARGRGVGRALLEALIESSEAHGIWTLQVPQSQKIM